MRFRMHPLMLTSLLAALLLVAARQAEPQPQTQSPTQKELRAEAKALRPLVESALGTSFLVAWPSLSPGVPSTIYRGSVRKRFITVAEYQALDSFAQADMKVYDTTEKLFYYTKYGSPLAYVRAIDLVGQAGLNDFNSKKILDFGYGTIGHLRLIAANGANVYGLDVDSFLKALYGAPGTTGPFKGADGVTGSVTLVDGRLNQEDVAKAIGDGYDLIISKNTLKNGYIHPPAELNVDKRLLVDLGMDDATFVKTLFDRLKPGGFLMIYNISPKQADLAAGKPYIPWADGTCPFSKDLLEKTGFTIVEFDRTDDAVAREMAHLLKWDEGEQPMDLQNDLFSHYTLLRKPAAN